MHDIGFIVFLVLAVLVAGAIVAAVIYFKVRAERKVSAAFTKLAQRFEDGVLSTDTWGKRTIRFTHQGLEIEVSGLYNAVSHTNRNDGGHLEMRVDWPVFESRMELYRRNVFNSISSYMFGSRVLTGDHWLDRYYTITGSPKEDIRNMLAPALPAILRLSRVLNSAILEMSLRDGVLRITKRFSAREFLELDSFLEKCLDVLEALALISAVGVEFVESKEPTPLHDVVCKICGDHIDQLAVKCASCKTIHHHDCWTYAGVCSTYGCGQTKYLPISAPLETSDK